MAYGPTMWSQPSGLTKPHPLLEWNGNGATVQAILGGPNPTDTLNEDLVWISPPGYAS